MPSYTASALAGDHNRIPGAPLPEHISTHLPAGTIDRIDAARRPGETRPQLIRAAVEAELVRREQPRLADSPDAPFSVLEGHQVIPG